MTKHRQSRASRYEDYRRLSGWYLAAWRDFRGLTLEELVFEIGVSKGYISDLETGAARANRAIRRYNRDMVEAAAKALQTTPGQLMDVNPFAVSEDYQRLVDGIAKLAPKDQDAILGVVDRLTDRSAA